jgi:excisionase family DNA binding protein
MSASIWLTPQQASEYCKVDVVTLRRAVQRGYLYAYRVNGGTRVRYRVVDLDRWLASFPVNEVKEAARA